MTIPNTVNVLTAVGPQSSPLSIPFLVVQQADVAVYLQSAAGVTPVKLTLNTDYTVALLNQLAGAQLLFVSSGAIGTSLATGAILTISRDPAQVQTTALQAQGPFPAPSVQQITDQLTTEVQANRTRITNSVQFPVVESLAGLTSVLPVAAARANGFLGFDASGNVIIGVPSATSVPITGLVQILDTMAALRALPTPIGAVTYLLRGYNAIGDGGGGFFYWNSTDTRGDNWGTVIALTVGGIGRFNRILNGQPLSVAHFGTYGNGTSHPISSAQATAINATYNIGAAANDETDWIATQVAVIVVSQLSIAANTVANAYRYGAVVTMPQGVFVFNKTLQMRFGVTLQGSGRTSFHIDVSGTYPTGTIITYTGGASAAAINITGFVAATGLPVAYNVTMHGTDLDAGTYSGCEDCTVRDLTVYTAVSSVVYGINMTGAPTSNLVNVMVNGFQTGINIGACWGLTLTRIQVLATLVPLNMGSDTNGCSFNDIYLNGTSSATSSSIGLQTNFVRACHFSRLVIEHVQTGISATEMLGCTINGLYFEDIGQGCVSAISAYGLTINGIYFNCLAAWGFKLQNFSQVVATSGNINLGASSVPQIAAVVTSIASGAVLDLIGFIPTAAETTKDFGAGGMIRYIDGQDGSGNIMRYTMAEGATDKINMPDSSSQLVTQYQVAGVAKWDSIAGPTYFRLYDLVNTRYAFQFNFTGGPGSAPAMTVETTQVITVRQTGYTNPWTGAQDRATAFDPSTVTLAQLAARVSAMQADVTTHGLIGP